MKDEKQEIDTELQNKLFEAVRYLWNKLTDEQRLELPMCKSCGSLDTTCQCLNDE